MAPAVRARLRTVGRLITYAAGAASAIWFVLFVYVGMLLTQAPLHPDRASGHLIPWSNHGVIHYVTQRANDLEDILFSGGIWIILVMFVGLLLYRGRHMFDRR